MSKRSVSPHRCDGWTQGYKLREAAPRHGALQCAAAGGRVAARARTCSNSHGLTRRYIVWPVWVVRGTSFGVWPVSVSRVPAVHGDREERVCCNGACCRRGAHLHGEHGDDRQSSVDTFTSLSSLMSVGLCDREECVCEAEGRRWEAEGAPAPGTAYGTVARGPPRMARPPPARAQPRRVRVVILYIYIASWLRSVRFHKTALLLYY